MSKNIFENSLSEGIEELAKHFSVKYSNEYKIIYNGGFIDKQWAHKLMLLADDISAKAGKRVHGFSIIDIKKIITDITVDYKLGKIKKDDIVKNFKDKIDALDEMYWVMRPIKGINIHDDIKIKLGPFEIFRKNSAKKIIEEKFVWVKENEEVSKQNELENLNCEYFIGLDVKAKTKQGAIDLADERFDEFESIIKFMMQEDDRYGILVRHYEKAGVSDVIAVSKFEYHNGCKLEGIHYTYELSEAVLKEGKFAVIWRMMNDYHNGSINEWHKRILLAIICTGHAAMEHNKVNKFLQYIFAMEIALYNNYGGIITSSIANQISELSAFIINKDVEKRKEIFKDMKTVYSKRSAVVHSGNNNLNDTIFVKAKGLIYTLIYSILNNDSLMKLNNVNELYEWMLNQKFQ